ncbi:MAG: hypothetical protein ACNA8P_12185, partial [Phycisphaerales bacterium]
MPPTPQHDGHAASDSVEHSSGVLLLTLPLHPPSTMTLDRKVWREAVREATRSYGEFRCMGLYLLLLCLGVGATGLVFVLLQWLLDTTAYALWAWGIGLLALILAAAGVIGVTRYLLNGPKRHLALVLEVRGIILCAR